MQLFNSIRLFGIIGGNRSVRYSFRIAKGSQMVEFGAALVVLVAFIILPLVNFSIIPVHWLLCQEIVTNYTHRLALCQKFSQTLTMLDTDDSITSQLLHLGGVKPQQINCCLIISQTQPPFESFVTNDYKYIPPAWLPGGGKSPCIYEIKLSVRAEFSPLVLINFFNMKIPGLNKPFIGVLEAKSAWENCGCDPASGRFFMNE